MPHDQITLSSMLLPQYVNYTQDIADINRLILQLVSTTSNHKIKRRNELVAETLESQTQINYVGT
jgi:hypothetical protein